MIRLYQIVIIFLMLLYIDTTSIASPTPFISIDALLINSNTEHSQPVRLMNTSGNTYLAAQSWQQNESVMLGIGLHTYQQHGIDLNTSLRYMSNITTHNHGDVLQLYSPKYRNLSYTYDVTTQLVLVENVVTWTKHTIQPGLIFGIGHASNSTSNYREAPLNPHSSASSEPFTANTRDQ